MCDVTFRRVVSFIFVIVFALTTMKKEEVIYKIDYRMLEI